MKIQNKTCSICHKLKPLSDFQEWCDGKMFEYSYCKACDERITQETINTSQQLIRSISDKLFR